MILIKTTRIYRTKYCIWKAYKIRKAFC